MPMLSKELGLYVQPQTQPFPLLEAMWILTAPALLRIEHYINFLALANVTPLSGREPEKPLDGAMTG